MTHLGNDWDELLKEEAQKDYMNKLREFLKKEYEQHTIYPPKAEIFTALKLTPYNKVKVVILGQDPYHQPNQAHGLAFSVKEGNPPPPSLKNIYKEINSSLGTAIPKSGELTHWATQGVLLLNTVLTVRRDSAGSHRGYGWEQFTNYIITVLNKREEPIIFLLWGADAKKKLPLITSQQHIIFSSVHPSPLSAYGGFFGCNHFKLTNEALKKLGSTEIVW